MSVTRKLPVETIRSQLNDAIRAGHDLASQANVFRVFARAYSTWDKRNEIILDQAFATQGWLETSPRATYALGLGLEYPFGTEFGPEDESEETKAEKLLTDVRAKLERLVAIRDLADAYEGPEDDDLPDGLGEPAGSPAVIGNVDVSASLEAEAAVDDQPSSVFIIHGRATSHRLEIELVLTRATEVKPVVLGEQLNSGLTLIEKLEQHLHPSRAAFAVVLLTGDDIGGLNSPGEPQLSRARQNVILELGYAMAALGRRRVVILHESGLDIPSDIAGVAYWAMDDGGAWKFNLLGELAAGGLNVYPDRLLPGS